MSHATLATDAEVGHAAHGRGNVLLDRGPSVVVRFAHGIEEVPRGALTIGGTTGAAVVPLPGLLRLMADCVRSVNDAWGVFSRSRIDLLPHQLWVCRKVSATWPTRWLVADDVGLGKTIEAGLVLWPLVSRGLVRRLLILCPASLVAQWQQRLRTMFDLRCAIYAPELDTPKSDFWGTHPFVVASIDTLRLDNRGRRLRMLEAEPWDLLVVDEAHRLNTDEERGPTEGYKLVQSLRDAGRFVSMLFFTGTPHRGKNYGFLSLLALLRPDEFQPRSAFEPQLTRLRSVMIRNNKQDVTDLAGNKLFIPPWVESATYSYSPAEREFYDTLTNFITSGKAYARGLGDADGRAVMLVLISMQKLASSSAAAIASAFRKRLAGLASGRRELAELQDRRHALSVSDLSRIDEDDGDALAALDERIGELDERLALVEDEEPRLRELVALAGAVGPETKVERIIGDIRPGGRFAGRSVLLFTEYKATQALVLARLEREFGLGCCAFINGDDRLDNVPDAEGRPRVLRSNREQAADDFNAGRVRFLIATEAGGEGIDLQQRCHTLVHVDLPWNPMRLHQRVGRLNRYGQRERVEVLTLRNPATVESRIWDHLNAKLERIQKAFTGAMDDPEDILQLVLGMASPTLFRELFADAPSETDKLAGWFDGKTSRLGGEDAVDAVKRMVGHCARFNFGDVGGRLPRVDLPDLRPLVIATLAHLRRRADVGDDGSLSFLTPDDWRREVGVKARYDGLTFDRRGDAAAVAGVGHKLVDRAIRDALALSAGDVPVSRELLAVPIVVFRVRDRVTGGNEPPIVVGVEFTGDGPRLLTDWQLLRRLNKVVLADGRAQPPAALNRPASLPETSAELATMAETFLREGLVDLGVGFAVPEIGLIAQLIPSE